jgi:hypothetical protein
LFDLIQVPDLPADVSADVRELIGPDHQISVLDDGHVYLVDVMGGDNAIVDAARVCYGAGTRKVSADRGLIRYLMAHRHTTPFEMAEIKFRVRVPMDAWRQWIRHRTANVNEYSTRYSLAIDSAQRTAPDEWRSQSKKNNQGSAEPVTEFPEGFEYPEYLADEGACAGPQGSAAVHVHRSVLEDRFAQPVPFLGTEVGWPRADRDSCLRTGYGVVRLAVGSHGVGSVHGLPTARHVSQWR